MKRAAAGLGLALVAWSGALQAEPRAVEIGLTELGVVRVADAWKAPGPAGAAASGPEEPSGETALEVFLRLPLEPVLHLDLGASPPGRLVVEVASDGREPETLPLPAAGGPLRAPLPDFAGRVVRIRFRGPGAERVALAGARIRGTADAQPALLPRSPDAAGRRWNVLVYVVDALRPDRLSLYGYTRPTSPKLDAIAARAIVFENAYATGPNTLHSIPALFTSLSATEAAQRLRFARGPRSPTLAEAFRAGGYATAAFQANFLLKSYLGFDRGFGIYRIVLGRGERGPLADAAELHSHVFDWIHTPRRRPSFLYVQSLDVHNPYRPPAPFRGRFGGDPDAELDPAHYDDAVAYQDHELGSLVAALGEIGLRDSTILVITSDHGESLGEGGRVLHGGSLTEEQVRVPLILSLPWQTEPRREEAVVSLMDLGPTLLELAGLPIPPRFQGTSLLSAAPFEQPRIAAGEKPELGWFLREGGWKLVVDPERRASLYHVAADPNESQDLAAAQPVRTAYLTSLLWQRSRSFRNRGQAPPDPGRGLDEGERRDMKESLRALGYIE